MWVDLYCPKVNQKRRDDVSLRKLVRKLVWGLFSFYVVSFYVIWLLSTRFAQAEYDRRFQLGIDPNVVPDGGAYSQTVVVTIFLIVGCWFLLVCYINTMVPRVIVKRLSDQELSE
jgi:hypothetical protein